MLALTRKVGESIMIGDDIKITIISYKEGKIRLGFEAPRDVEIWREEIYPGRKDELSEKGC